jgi:hypothetical protein
MLPTTYIFNRICCVSIGTVSGNLKDGKPGLQFYDELCVGWS